MVLAKMALQIEHISRGRFALNLVNAWNKIEIEHAGLVFPEHHARYAYGREWLSVVSALMRGERVQHSGRHFQVNDYVLRPAGTHRARPPIYVGGESEAARALVADAGDYWLINGRPLAELAPLMADVSARPRSGAPLRFGLSAFVIGRHGDYGSSESRRPRWPGLIRAASEVRQRWRRASRKNCYLSYRTRGPRSRPRRTLDQTFRARTSGARR